MTIRMLAGTWSWVKLSGLHFPRRFDPAGICMLSYTRIKIVSGMGTMALFWEQSKGRPGYPLIPFPFYYPYLDLVRWTK